MVSVSIVIPIHNEAGFLATAWARLRPELEQLEADVSVYLVENGSTDETLAIARGLEGSSVFVLSLPQPDYGAAMREGFLAAAEADWIVNFDIDYFSVPFIRDLFDIDADVVIASKRAPGSDDRRSALRRAGTRTFNLLLQTLFGSRVSDTHGIKGFRGQVVTRLVPMTTRTLDLFDTELVLRAEMAGHRITEVPIVVEELRETRSSFVKRVPRTLKGLLQLRRSFSSERRNTRSR
ncbi:MAG: glycosyltransferase family 2 protein [Acidimicrobiia bacterium]|nr:glycosyltransferase family 2 protein [Acidimicrobiia bacterium]